MGFQLFNFNCVCGHGFEAMTGKDFDGNEEPVKCPACGSADVQRGLSSLKSFEVIRATTRTSGRYKAGTIHKYHRPKEKISVAVPK